MEVHFGASLSPDPVSTSIVRVADERWIWGQAICVRYSLQTGSLAKEKDYEMDNVNI